MISPQKREKLSALEHDQWVQWSQQIAKTENISADRLARWKKLWVPYSQLSESYKDDDRKWADKVIKIIG
jgi:hypothetical protein